jgi:hypothetical protein
MNRLLDKLFFWWGASAWPPQLHSRHRSAESGALERDRNEGGGDAPPF